jgi:hypothetical protein
MLLYEENHTSSLTDRLVPDTDRVDAVKMNHGVADCGHGCHLTELNVRYRKADQNFFRGIV